MPTIDDCLDRLKRAGWGVGHAAFGATWQVDGTNGENALIRTRGDAGRGVPPRLRSGSGGGDAGAGAGGVAPRVTPRSPDRLDSEGVRLNCLDPERRQGSNAPEEKTGAALGNRLFPK